MNRSKTLNLTCALVLVASSAFSQSPDRTATATRCAGFPRTPATSAALLELRLANHTVPPSLELRGGTPGSLATIAVADSLAAPPLVGHGVFDAEGCFATTIELARFPAGTFVAQGFGAVRDLEGRWLLHASNGLQVAVAMPSPTRPSEPAAPAAADFSLLRIELDDWHGDQVADQVLAQDFVGALGTALNSHGDALQAKISGKLMVCVPGTPVQVGGSVGYSAKIARDGSEYLVSIGQEVAVQCGVKATKGIGVEGGISLGGEQIYRFASPAEVARGLFGIALQQALPGALEAARGENLAMVRELRQHIGGLVAALDRLRARRFGRLPAVERALDAALGAIVAVHGHLRRIVDVLDRAAGWVVDEAQFVRDHTDGVELRLAKSGEISLKIGEKTLGGLVGAELGGKIGGGGIVTVRMFQGWDEEPRRIEVLVAQVVGGSFAAGIKLGSLAEGNSKAYGRSFEISQKVTRGLRTVFEREGADFGAPQLAIVIKREFGLLNFGRETTIEFDARELGAAGITAVMALFDGEPAKALGALAPVHVQLGVQDKLALALKPEFGVENTALTAKVGGEFSWSDCGPQRTTELTLAEVCERLLDVERTAAEALELAQQVLELEHLQ